MDKDQLYRLYGQETSYHSNPPSFSTWCRNKGYKQNSSGDFILSAVIGAATGSAIVGGFLGGDLLGGIVGDLFEGTDDGLL
jgi:hypothetical protein